MQKDGLKRQCVRTEYLTGWRQVPLNVLNEQSMIGLNLEGPGYTKTVALTFDDGPSEYTTAILKILSRNNIKATFFMTGESVKKRPKIARKVLLKGHCFGNHTYDHPRASCFSDIKLLAGQIHKTDKVFRRYLNKTTRLFRPAYGDVTDGQLTKVNSLGYHCFAWSIDTKDWYFKRPSKICREVSENLHPEAIVLMHDGGGNRVNTVNALQMIIDECRSRNYQFVTLDFYTRVGA